MNKYKLIRAGLLGAGLALAGSPAAAQVGGPFNLTWSTIDCGGSTGGSSGATFVVAGTGGQPDAGQMSGGAFVVIGGFWSVTAGVPCYANCDGSTSVPVLNVADFTCFLQKFALGDPYANCDGSTGVPALNVADFTCFLQKFALGCP
jgi:hypothetical protein